MIESKHMGEKFPVSSYWHIWIDSLQFMWGPCTIASSLCAFCFITIVDDYTWIYLIGGRMEVSKPSW